jgi:hypothetical protein
VTCAVIAPEALAGNVNAVMAVLPIMIARCRLLGLHDVKPDRKARERTKNWDNWRQAADCRGSEGRLPAQGV